MKPLKPSALDVLAFLRFRGELGVTPAQAREAVHTDRLGARIFELRQAGYNVRREWVTVGSARFAKYVLHEVPARPAPDRGTQIGAFAE